MAHRATLSSAYSSALPSLHSAMSVLLLLCFVSLLQPLSPLQSVDATNVCICECCAGSSCLKDWNTTFAIDSCPDCTKVNGRRLRSAPLLRLHQPRMPFLAAVLCSLFVTLTHLTLSVILLLGSVRVELSCLHADAGCERQVHQ